MSSEERSLLKNLGSWLGKLTIGKNQPLRAREVDPKSLIIEVSIYSSHLQSECTITGNSSLYCVSWLYFSLRL